jgi:uncharacterized protein involved in exopolysaccharide biosynthesis
MTASARDTWQDEPPLSVLSTMVFLLRYRRAILLTALGAAVLMVAVTLAQPRTWTTRATFAPQATGKSQALSGLAAQLGVQVPGNEATQSPSFYVDVLRSRELLAEVAYREYQVGGARGTYLTIAKAEGEDSLQRRDDAIARLLKQVSASVTQKTGVVNMAVRTPSPELSRQLADELLAALNRFNLERRRSQASEERRFTQARLDELRGELRDAENRLQYFLQRNRDFRNSPELSFQHERLQRDVRLREQVYSSLAQSFEQARIDEVRDTPVITVVEKPDLAVRPDSRQLVARGLAALVAGLVLGVLLALWRSRLRGDADASTTEAQQYQELRREFWRDVRAPWRLLS